LHKTETLDVLKLVPQSSWVIFTAFIFPRPVSQLIQDRFY